MASVKGGVEVGRLLAALVAASYRYRLWFRLQVWVAVLAAAFLAFVVSLALHTPWFVSTGLLAPAGVIATGVAARAWTLRRSKHPLLALICRFEPSSDGARNASYDHQLLLKEVLEDDHQLADVIDARKLEPLSKKQAEVVMGESGARAGVYGEVRVQGEHWMAKGGILLDPPAGESAGVRGFGAPLDHEPLIDRERPLRELVSATVPEHMQTVRAELLKIALMLDA